MVRAMLTQSHPVKRVFKNDESPQLHQRRRRDRSYAPRLRGTHERTRITTNGIAQIHIGTQFTNIENVPGFVTLLSGLSLAHLDQKGEP